MKLEMKEERKQRKILQRHNMELKEKLAMVEELQRKEEKIMGRRNKEMEERNDKLEARIQALEQR